MEVVANNYLPGDQRLVDKIVYELKAQGIFDQFRKECFADVDTKPAYQNLRQRVESNVTGFLKDQNWRPDMNKNQVREMLRKTITESGYLETGVERIVDQVVNPKINTVFLPKVEEVVYSYLGIKKPNRNEVLKSEPCDLLPNDLEAVSPESEPVDKKDDKSTDNFQDLEETKTEEDESPPFEPLEEQTVYVAHEENSVDSHLSGFSGLISHESNQSNDNKVTPMEQDSQMSRNSSDSRLSIVTSDENSKMEICEDSQPKSVKSSDSNSKNESEKNKHKSSDKHKSRSESKSDKDRKSKDSKYRHSSSSKDKDKDKSRDRKESKSTSSGNNNKNEKDKEKDKIKEKSDKDRGKSSSNSNSKHSSSSSGSTNSKDKNGKKDSSKLDKDKDKDKNRSSSSHKDSKPRDKSSDSRKEKSSSSDKHKHSSSSSSHRDKDKKDKDKKKETKSKDDHYSSKDKKNDRRSTDRDSNDGQSGKQNFPINSESSSSQSQKTSQESSFGGGDSGNSDQTENTTKAPVIITGIVESAEVTISSPESQRVKVLKPKCASNMQEALRLRKIRKQLAKLEKQNQLSLASVDVSSPILLSSSINFDDLNQNIIEDEKTKQETLNSKIVSELEVVPSPLQNTVISQDNWDAMEAKLRAEVVSEFKEYNDDSLDDSVEGKLKVEAEKSTKEETEEEDCKYFESVDIAQIEFLLFVEKIIKSAEQQLKLHKGKTCKRKAEDNDLKNNNNRPLKAIPEKRAKLTKKNKEKNNEVSANEKFPLPLSPAESEKSIGKKDETIVTPVKPKRNSLSKMSNQRYSSDDLYKPRPTFASSRRRGAKNVEN